MIKNLFLTVLLILTFTICHNSYAQVKDSKNPDEITGILDMRYNDCFNPNFNGVKETYFIVDPNSGKMKELDVSTINKQNLNPGRKITVKGNIKSRVTINTDSTEELFVADELLYLEEAPKENIESPVKTLSTQALSCLLIFADTNDTTAPQSKKDAVKQMLFETDQNASEAMKDATYGKYSLQLGNGDGNPALITVSLNLTASTTSSGTMRSSMISAAESMGYNLNSYDRVLFFCPEGTLNGGSSNWTAYAYFYTPHSVYSYGWTGTFFDAFLHELGHNFALSHSNRLGGEYQDVSCCMGYSHRSTNPEAATFNPVKKVYMGSFDPYPSLKTSLSVDSTLDLYPLADDPVNGGMRVVQFNGTEYYVSYRRNISAYGKLWASRDRDKVIIYEKTNNTAESNQLKELSVGQSYDAGDINIKFDVYGNNLDYARVSFDLNNSNDKPIANAQSVNTNKNTPLNITLTGSDNNNDNLTYSVFSDPQNGTLSGSGTNLTYTPNNNYFGSDSFLFEVSDGNISSFETISITVIDVNSAPTVSLGDDQTVYLSDTVVSVTPGADIYLNAGLDDGANSTWEDSLGIWNLDINSGVTYLANAGSNYTGISGAYSFPGGTAGNAGCDGATFHNLADTQPLSIELWFKPTVSSGYTSNGQVLWETGGGTGFGIFYNNGVVEVAHDSNVSQISADVSTLINEFIQIVVTYDTTVSTDNYKLYINGLLRATASRSDSDLSGSDSAGLGNRGGNNTGGAGSGDSNSESFEGMIAIFRSYFNQILTGEEVQANFKSVAGDNLITSLSPSVNDSDGDTLIIFWSVVNGPGTVTFEDPSDINTRMLFTRPGVYTLRLTVDDGEVQVTDDIVITVNEAGLTFTVTFVEGANGTRTGGGALVQTVAGGASAIAPQITANSGYNFTGWSTSFSNVNSNLTVTAQYEAIATGNKVARYRVYNPNEGHHHYTTNFAEYDFLGTVGWNLEGISCYIYDSEAMVDSVLSKVYYRTYNPNSGEHFWTMSENEYNFLGSVGWNLEGTDGYLFDQTVTAAVPLYRLYNPNSGYHHWTMDANERNFLISLGWNDEGIAGYVFASAD